MGGDHGGAGDHRAFTRSGVGDGGDNARGGVLQAAAALLQRRPATLGALEPFPFRGDGAPDVGQERGRLGPGALEHRSRLLARAAFGVARGGQPRRRLGLAALQLARALGLRAVARVELGEQLAEPARVRGAVALGAQDQLRR